MNLPDPTEIKRKVTLLKKKCAKDSMSNNQSTGARRSSLVPPHGPIGRPNAMMVDDSKIVVTPFNHSRQCDEDLRPRQEKEAITRQERLSLINAENFVQQHRSEVKK